MRNVLIIVGVLVISGILFVGSVHLFGKHIYNTRSCNVFNIDNIELRTGVNIPKVTATECQCTNDTKVSKFIIDSEQIEVDDYIKKNNFKLIDDLYIKANDNENSTYKVVFNKETSELIVNLTYKN